MSRLIELERSILKISTTSCDVADHCQRRRTCEYSNPEFTKLLIKHGRKALVEPGYDQHVY